MKPTTDRQRVEQELKARERAEPEKRFILRCEVRGRWPNTVETWSVKEVERVDCGQWGKTIMRYRVIEGERGPIVVAAGDPRIKGVGGWVPTGITQDMTEEAVA